MVKYLLPSLNMGMNNPSHNDKRRTHVWSATGFNTFYPCLSKTIYRLTRKGRYYWWRQLNMIKEIFSHLCLSKEDTTRYLCVFFYMEAWTPHKNVGVTVFKQKSATEQCASFCSDLMTSTVFQRAALVSDALWSQCDETTSYFASQAKVRTVDIEFFVTIC